MKRLETGHIWCSQELTLQNLIWNHVLLMRRLCMYRSRLRLIPEVHTTSMTLYNIRRRNPEALRETESIWREHFWKDRRRLRQASNGLENHLSKSTRSAVCRVTKMAKFSAKLSANSGWPSFSSGAHFHKWVMCIQKMKKSRIRAANGTSKEYN